MSDNASRNQRAVALEEKRRKLDELKKKREGRTITNATADGSIGSSGSNNLEDYIDTLLKDSSSIANAGVGGGDTTATVSTILITGTGTSNATDATQRTLATTGSTTEDATNSSTTNSASSINTNTLSVQKAVETFSIATQTYDIDNGEEDDEDEKDKKADKDAKEDMVKEKDRAETVEDRGDFIKKEMYPQYTPKILSIEKNPEAIQKVLKQPSFTNFITATSKNLERYLSITTNTTHTSTIGTTTEEGNTKPKTKSVLDVYYIDYGNNGGTTRNMDNDDDDDDRNDTDDVDVNSKKKYASKFISSKVIYDCSKWTTTATNRNNFMYQQQREVTDIAWSPIHPELLLSTYNSNGYSSISSMTTYNAATTSSTNNNSSAPRSSELLSADGLVCIWSPYFSSSSSKSSSSNSNKPEYILMNSGCSITTGIFHPTTSHLILGGCSTGQIVLWDIRASSYTNSKLPISKSAIPTVASSSSSKGTTTSSSAAGPMHHTHAINSMQVIDNGLSLVTTSIDGRLNIWSMNNLHDPVESIQVNDSISCCCTATSMISSSTASDTTSSTGTESFMIGDEHGNLYSIMTPNTSSTMSIDTKATVGASTTTSRTSSPVPPSTGGTGTTSGQRVSRRQIKKIDTPTPDGDGTDNNQNATSTIGHYGMITSISAKNRRVATASLLTKGGFGRSNTNNGCNGFLLTSGIDWTVKVWAPINYNDYKPVLSFVNPTYDYMCDVAWHPTHPTLFATASSNGSLGFYNLAQSLDEPITGTDGIIIDSQQQPPADVTNGINKIKWSVDGKRIAVAASDKVHVLTLSDDLLHINGDEDTKVTNQLVSRGLV